MMSLRRDELVVAGSGIAAVALLSLLPLFSDGFALSFGVNLMLYAAMCTAWALFSGPTRLVSLASAAFFGVGTYSVALGLDSLPFPALIAIATL